MTTSTMSDTLRAELVRRGWDPDFVTWGRRVSGDVHGVTLERDGLVRYYPGPFVALERDGLVRYYPGPFVALERDGQKAIVRWG